MIFFFMFFFLRFFFLWVGLDMVLGIVFCKKSYMEIVKNVKKIVNASKVPRIWFSATNSRNFRFFMILLEFL